MLESDGIASGDVSEGSVPASPVLPVPVVPGLNAMQSAFVAFYCENGGDGTAAAIEAGYGGGAKNMATRNLLKPKIQAEIESRIKMGRGTALVKAMNRLLAIVDDSEDHRAAVQAALGLMDRCGMAAPRGPAIVNNVNVMTGNAAQEIIQEVYQRRQERLARQAGTQSASQQVLEHQQPARMSDIPISMTDIPQGEPAPSSTSLFDQ